MRTILAFSVAFFASLVLSLSALAQNMPADITKVYIYKGVEKAGDKTTEYGFSIKIMRIDQEKKEFILRREVTRNNWKSLSSSTEYLVDENGFVIGSNLSGNAYNYGTSVGYANPEKGTLTTTTKFSFTDGKTGTGRLTTSTERITDGGKELILKKMSNSENISIMKFTERETWSCSTTGTATYDPAGWIVKLTTHERCTNGYQYSDEVTLERVANRRYPIDKEIRLERLDLIKRRD